MGSFCQYICLVVIIICFAEGPSVLAMPGEEEGEQSSYAFATAAPSPPTTRSAAAAAGVDETPGLFLSRRQARIFQKAAFETIIGAERVAQWGIAWEVFEDTSSPYTAEKLLNLHRLCEKMKRVQEESTFQQNEDFQDLYGRVFGIKDQVEAIHLKRLKGVVGRYFLMNFPSGSTVEFSTKDSGVQLGTIAKIKDPAGRDHTFYVKTHSEGKLTSKSTAAKKVNPSELFVYKVLEALGVGCEADFCARSPEDVYLMTRDAKEGGRFFLFKDALDNEERLGRDLWGRLGDLNKRTWEADQDEVEQWLSQDPIAQNFAHQLVTVDVLSRLFGIHDLLNNAENFGFFHPVDGPYRARILDFRLDVRSVEQVDPIFYGLLSGNGTFNYGASHKTVGFLLRERERTKRVAIALNILTTGHLRTLEEAIDTSYQTVRRFIQETPAFNDTMGKFIEDLTAYKNTLQQNRVLLIEKLTQWEREARTEGARTLPAAGVVPKDS